MTIQLDTDCGFSRSPLANEQHWLCTTVDARRSCRREQTGQMQSQSPNERP